jgi:hypothetical protein
LLPPKLIVFEPIITGLTAQNVAPVLRKSIDAFGAFPSPLRRNISTQENPAA